MKMNPSFPWIPIAVVLSMTWVFVPNVEAGKPIDAEPGQVQLSGNVTADNGDLFAPGPVGTFDVEVKSGKETIVTIVVRHFWFDAGFAKSEDFINGKYASPDGAACFGESVMASGAYRLYEDGSAEFSTYPEFLTADSEEIQKYQFFLTGKHDVEPLESFPVTGAASVTLSFDRVEITTEGKGQNRRRSCTGEFNVFNATATFSR